MSSSRVVFAIVLLLFLAGQAEGSTVTYTKTFLADKVNEGATIQNGEQVQTWVGTSIVPDAKVKIAAGNPPVQRSYDHSNIRTGGFSNFPIHTARDLLGDPITVKTGFSSQTFMASDGHTESNSASAMVDVKARIPGDGQTVNVRKIGEAKLTDSVTTVIKGHATAGTVLDADPVHNVHSADSFAGVGIEAAETFRVLDANRPIPLVSVFTKNIMIGGADVFEPPPQDRGFSPRDPLFMTVRDVTTPGSSIVLATEIIMTQELDSLHGQFSVDDSGIRLIISRNLPDSFVSLKFQSESPWVVNPYTYGATLSNAGLTAFGETPLERWTITQTDNRLEAFFAFGPGGQPFDSIVARPPDSLFQLGRTYSYDLGVGNGAFVVEAVPEPSSFVLFGIGISVLILYQWRPSKLMQRGHEILICSRRAWIGSLLGHSNDVQGSKLFANKSSVALVSNTGG